MRMSMKSPHMKAAITKISRATTRLDEVKKYYTKDINVTMLHNMKFDDGSEFVTYTYDMPFKDPTFPEIQI